MHLISKIIIVVIIFFFCTHTHTHGRNAKYAKTKDGGWGWGSWSADDVHVCVYVCFQIIPYVNCFGRTVLYVCTEYCI